MNELPMLPRFIRANQAPAYLGMNRNLFRTLVAPSLTTIPIAKQGKAYDRLDLDRWADNYKAAMGVPPKDGGILWLKKPCQDSGFVTDAGISTKGVNIFQEGDFGKALASVRKNKRKPKNS